RRMAVAVEAVGPLAPWLGRRHRAPVEIALRRAADRRGRNPLGTVERHAVADREADALRMAVHHRLVDRTEVDAPKLARRQLCRTFRAAERVQKTEHARLN